MQKKIIALAVAGLVSGAAFAQSNVTIYGVADAGFVNAGGDRNAALNKRANVSGIESGILAGSRIGFKGEEGLGNGLKAVFTLEYSLGIDSNLGVGATGGINASGLASRQSFVGLNHAKLGTVALGRQYAPGYGASARNDALVSSALASSQEVLRGAAGSKIAAASAARINNSISYASPNWSGFTVNAIYGFGETGTNAVTTSVGGASATNGNGISQGNDGFFGAGLNYANGPMNIDVVYQTTQGRSTSGSIVGIAAVPATGVRLVTASASTQDSVNEWMLAGTYDFKVVKLFASYQDLNDNNGTSAQDASNKMWSIGATMPVFTNGTVRFSYSDLEWDRNGAGGSDSWALGYTHALSKRTTLYTTYTYTDNDRNALFAAGSAAAVRAIGESNYAFTAGLNHTF
jgi:predicted porin